MQYFTGTQDGTNVIQDSFVFKISKTDTLMNVLRIINRAHFAILCETGIFRQFADEMTGTDLAIVLIWLLPLAFWMYKTSWGRNALADSVPRRNNMPLYLPFIPLLIWFGATQITVSITRKLLTDLQPWQSAFVENLVLCFGAIIVIAVIIFLAEISFARRLKGFGLSIKTIHKDFIAGAVNLLCIWPLVMLTITATILLGKLICGQDFQVQRHEELELITAHPQLPLRVLIVVVAVVIAPLIEELLFRGLFQTMIRSFFEIRNSKPEIRNRAWAAILITSVLFAMAHANPGHWPALFVIGICMGYAYEKSGSLFRPVFIHSFFNAATIIATLYRI